ncbi:conserved exported hypothetical protein [Candidatus Sulfopaludibacter sp. SbA6]|nr:conserved exported hypothetical protein [Candidatus Sulfopaludibacter sp. SbA6]
MIRVLQVGGLLWLAVAVGLSNQNKAAKTPPPPRPPAGRPNAPNKGGNGGGAKALGPRITNPGSPAARLYRMSPEERERALEQLPPARQQAIRNQLQYFDSLPKDQQQVMLSRTERFAALPPEKKRAFMQQMQAVNQLPPERRQMVVGALRRLQSMSDQQRANVLNSQQFRNRFSPGEQKMIGDLSEVMLPPM